MALSTQPARTPPPIRCSTPARRRARSEYRASPHCAALQAACPERAYAPFGWAAAIAFPGAWASAFGALGGPQWARWARRCLDGGLPARSCVLHSLDLLQGARDAAGAARRPAGLVFAG
jgi:hypothetical protein